MRKYTNPRKTPRSGDEISAIEAQVREIYLMTDGREIDEQIETTELGIASHKSHLKAAREAFEKGLAPDDPDAPQGWGPPMDAAEFRRLDKTLLDLRKFREQRLAEIRARLEESADELHASREQEPAPAADGDEAFNQVMQEADRIEKGIDELARNMGLGNGQGSSYPTG